jgi:hypothetical protein
MPLDQLRFIESYHAAKPFVSNIAQRMRESTQDGWRNTSLVTAGRPE